MSSESSDGGGCGCLTIVIGILVFWALFFGVPVGDKKWNIDIFPPRIWDMSASDNAEVSHER